MRYIYGPGGMPLQLIVTKAGGSPTPYWYHLDPLGNVIALTDAEGLTTASYDYDPWGKAISTGTYQGDEEIWRANPLRYRGYFYDAALGLYVLPARVYDPALKRFLSVDPDASTALSPVEMNRYTYCINNPIAYDDPSGAAPDLDGDGKLDVEDTAQANYTANPTAANKAARDAAVNAASNPGSTASAVAKAARVAREKANAIAAAEQRAANARMMKTANMVGGIGSGVELVGASIFGLGAALDATVVGVGPGLVLNVIGGVLIAGSIACQYWAFQHAMKAGATREVAFGTAVTEYQVLLRLRESKSLNGLREK
jgi:RHS repeat-associated protein